MSDQPTHTQGPPIPPHIARGSDEAMRQWMHDQHDGGTPEIERIDLDRGGNRA